MGAWEGSQWQRGREGARERDEKEARRRGITLQQLREERETRKQAADGLVVSAALIPRLKDLMARLFAEGRDNDAALIRTVIKGASPRESDGHREA